MGGKIPPKTKNKKQEVIRRVMIRQFGLMHRYKRQQLQRHNHNRLLLIRIDYSRKRTELVIIKKNLYFKLACKQPSKLICS